MQNAGPGRLDTLRTTRMVSAGMGAGKALGEPGITLFMLLKVCILRFSGIKATKKNGCGIRVQSFEIRDNPLESVIPLIPDIHPLLGLGTT